MDEKEKKPKAKPRGKPFEPGVITNPNGAPKKADRAVAYLSKHIKEDDCAKLLVIMARSGSEKSLHLICEYFWGKPIQENRIGNMDGEQFRVIFNIPRPGDAIE